MQRYEHGGNRYGGEEVLLDFSVNTNAFGMPPLVQHAVQSAIAQFEHYPDTKCRALSAALAAYLQMPQAEILFGNGASDLIFRICAALRPQTVLTLAPTFSEYERPALLFGAQMRTHLLQRENDFLLTAAFLDDLTPDIDMVFLCNPNNPTGRLAPQEVLEAVLQKCLANGTYLVVDECFLEFTNGVSLRDKIVHYPNLLILRAFTKLYSLAGLRLGYLLGSASLLATIEPFGAAWAVSVPAQVAGVAALSTEPAWTAHTKAFTRTERTRLHNTLTALGCRVFASDANFLLVQSEKPLADALRKRGVLVRACANFTGLSDCDFRIAIKTPAENDVLIQHIQEAIHGESNYDTRHDV